MEVQITVVVLYLVVVFAVGVFASRMIKDATDFLLAGRRLGLLLATATLAATHFGGGFVMGGGQDGFRFGLSGFAFAIGTGLGLITLGLVSAMPLRKLRLYTVPDYLELRYNSKFVRLLGTLLSLVAIVGIIAAQVGASKGALSIFGISPQAGAVIAMLLFIAYTTFSGMWGVTLTDGVQLLIILIGLPVAAIAGINHAGGWAAMQASIAALNLPGGAESFFSPVGRGVSVMLGIIIPVIMYDLVGQDFYQRLFSAKDEKTAKNAAILAGFMLIIFGVFPAICGMVAKAIFGNTIEAAQALPKLITTVLPVWVGSIFVAAILAAVMSTADSLLTAGTSHIVNDIYIKTLHPEAAGDTKKLLLISRIWTVILGVAALVIALSIPGIIKILIYSYTMYASGVFVPVVAGLFWKRGNAQGAIAGIIFGALAGLLGLLKVFSYGAIPNIVVGGLISLAAYVIVSLLTPPPQSQS
ncbi:MAG: sodium:solute symporter family protein [Bacillota bacterium]